MSKQWQSFVSLVSIHTGFIPLQRRDPNQTQKCVLGHRRWPTLLPSPMKEHLVDSYTQQTSYLEP